jgi:hypothetical protein
MVQQVQRLVCGDRVGGDHAATAIACLPRIARAFPSLRGAVLDATHGAQSEDEWPCLTCEPQR